MVVGYTTPVAGGVSETDLQNCGCLERRRPSSLLGWIIIRAKHASWFGRCTRAKYVAAEAMTNWEHCHEDEDLASTTRCCCIGRIEPDGRRAGATGRHVG